MSYFKQILNEASSNKEVNPKNKYNIYYALTEEEAKKKTLTYNHGKLKSVNTTLDGLRRFIRDNDMEDTCPYYTKLSSSKFEIDPSIYYDEEYDMIAVKTPFTINIGKVNKLFDSVQENVLINAPDIYYNKDKFDSGEINLCFITGHSGSGKSTMGRDMQKQNIEHYELDDLQCIEDHFTMDQLKEYGDLIYSYFKGPGKQFYKSYKWLVDNKVPEKDYEDKLFPGFVHYAMNYAKTHKDKKFVIEGVWLYNDKWFTPSEFKDYAFYIKGTSMIISKLRAAKRDSQDAEKHKRFTAFKNFATKNWKWYVIDEKKVNRFRKYFENLMKVEELAFMEDMSGTIAAALPPANSENYYMVQHPQNNVFAYGITKDPIQNTMYGVVPQKDGSLKAYKTDKTKINKDYLTFKIRDSKSAKELYDELALLVQESNGTFYDNRFDPMYYLYGRITEGSTIIDNDQLLFDNRFELVRSIDEETQYQCESLLHYLKGKTPLELLEEQVDNLSITSDDPKEFYNVLPSNISSLEDLKIWKDKFDGMEYDNRVISNDLSTELYGEDNRTRYDKLYSSIVNNINPEKDIGITNESAVVSIGSLNELSSEINWDFTNHWDEKMKKVKEAEDQGLIIMVFPNFNDFVYFSEDNINKLKEKYNRLQGLEIEKRVLSNQTAHDIFGIDNDSLYAKFLTIYADKFTEYIKNDDLEEKTDPFVPMIPIAMNPGPYFTHDDVGSNYVSSKSNVVSKYTNETSQLLKELTLKCVTSSNKNRRNSLKNEIAALGWNPEIPYTEEMGKLVNLRKTYTSSVQESASEDEYIKYNNIDRVFEMASEILKNK